MLFSDQRKHSLRVPAKDDKGNAVTVGWLVHHLCEEVMKDTRKEMFVLDDHVYGPLFHFTASQPFSVTKSMPSTFHIQGVMQCGNQLVKAFL
jgi:hypothetical protein